MNNRTSQATIPARTAKSSAPVGMKLAFLRFVSDITMAMAIVIALALVMDVPGEVVLQAVAVFALITVCIVVLKRQLGTDLRFGPADRVTLARTSIAALCAGLLFQGNSAIALGWWLPAIAGISLALDGVDGWLARKTGTASEFGARFDMEIDAFFILVLSALVWQLDKTGPWVLAMGAMRYAFLAAAVFTPRLGAPLFKSRRRQTVCVIQVAALVICLIPIIGPQAATAVAAFALLSLFYSFAVDVVWLLQRADKPHSS